MIKTHTDLVFSWLGGIVSVISIMAIGYTVLTHSQAASAPNVLIWGSNLAMYNSSDQFLANGGTATALTGLHVQLLRMPLRDTLSSSDYTNALNKIKQMGATPLIVVHGETYGSDPYPTDSTVMNIAKNIFPTQTVYVDFGNEEDLQGASVSSYVSGQYGWNNEIPKLKALVGTNFKFGGPVNYQYNEGYIDTFVSTAKPSPDYIVWHAYAGSCGANNGTGQPDPQSKFLSAIPNWGSHIQQISNDMATQNNGAHKGMPIIIDEWNYASDLGQSGSNSPCYSNNQSFINQFFSNVFSTFVSSEQYGLIGSAEFEAVVGKDENMLDSSNNPTFQGTAFQSNFNTYFSGGTPPAPSVSLSAAQTSLSNGGSTTLSWSSLNAISCTASGGWSGNKPTSGSASSGSVASTTTYTLTCSGSGGSTAAHVTITVGASGSNDSGNSGDSSQTSGSSAAQSGDTPSAQPNGSSSNNTVALTTRQPLPNGQSAETNQVITLNKQTPWQRLVAQYGQTNTIGGAIVAALLVCGFVGYIVIRLRRTYLASSSLQENPTLDLNSINRPPAPFL